MKINVDFWVKKDWKTEILMSGIVIDKKWTFTGVEFMIIGEDKKLHIVDKIRIESITL